MDDGFPVLRLTIKGGKTIRPGIHPKLEWALRHYLEIAGHGDDKDAWLFRRLKTRLEDAGKPLSRQQIGRIFQHYAKQVGLPPQATPHCLRATFCTQTRKAGAALDDIQKTVGHAHVSTTQKYDKTGFSPDRSASLKVPF